MECPGPCLSDFGHAVALSNVTIMLTKSRKESQHERSLNHMLYQYPSITSTRVRPQGAIFMHAYPLLRAVYESSVLFLIRYTRSIRTISGGFSISHDNPYFKEGVVQIRLSSLLGLINMGMLYP